MDNIILSLVLIDGDSPIINSLAQNSFPLWSNFVGFNLLNWEFKRVITIVGESVKIIHRVYPQTFCFILTAPFTV